MRADYSRGLYRDYEALLKKCEKLEQSSKQLSKVKTALYRELDKEVKAKEAYELKLSEMQKTLSDKDVEIQALKTEILRLNGIINLDSNNSAIPTSQTPIYKNKRIPNSRKQTTKKKGGQKGHSKSKLSAFDESEVTEHEYHELSACPDCGGKLIKISEETIKDETDYEVVIVKKRHHYPNYQCEHCGKKVRANIPQHLKEENQYGSGVKSLALLLMNTGNTSVNKVRRMIAGLTEGTIEPSEGYIIKLQKTMAKDLEQFLTELQKEIISLKLLYWDDTVIMINKERGCLRYYGNEKLALYKAHQKKDKAGLDEDNILNLLPSDTTVMHDHNKVNYNEGYIFNNIECNAHLLRELEYIAENLPEHKWAGALRKKIREAYSKRNELIEKGDKGFPTEYVQEFFRSFDILILQGSAENEEAKDTYYTNKERQVINKLLNYKDNFFAWVTNFEYPFTNNLSERSLRGVKTKMKVSGQFQTESYAQHYAAIKSYIETCYRNGINEYVALNRLYEGHPYSIKEILSIDNTD